MKGNGSTFSWAVTLFAFGVLALNPPLARIFDSQSGEMILGIPVFYAFLFCTWLILIVLTAVLSHHLAPRQKKPPAASPRPSDTEI